MINVIRYLIDLFSMYADFQTIKCSVDMFMNYCNEKL